MHTLLIVLASSLLLWIALLYVRIPAPFGFAVLIPRSIAGGLSPWLAALDVCGLLGALLLGNPVAAVLFALAAGLALLAARRMLAVRGDFARAFGPDWQRTIPPERRAQVLAHPWRWRLPRPASARWQRDLPFASIPGSGRRLLCDLWQPAEAVKPSGLAYIYLHGSAWYILDKDAYTRCLFRHLAEHGHVVMDVAYRLYPETDVAGMVGDVKRAIAWMKAHAAEYGVDPDRIVIGGSSAGGHLAQLAGFAPDHAALTPHDMRGLDLHVAGIISCYGPSDLTACFHHTNHPKFPGVGGPPDLKRLHAPSPRWMGQHAARMGYHKATIAGRIDWLLGGTPEQVPAQYALCSPINHVHAGCPPTLLLQGEDDLITPAAATRALHARLQAAGVPAVNAIFPHTEHMFDLMLLGCSPSAQGALYEMRRFLAVLAAKKA